MSTKTASYWSGETLALRLGRLIEPFDVKRIDCAAYTLAIGEEVYVSPSDEAADKNNVTINKLAADEAFTIPPGQFAFLTTEEIVRVPSNAIAFISIRAKCKFRGLVNVSGFHVDPGFHGQLIFSVFNAGPTTIHLKRGQPIFLIWYADLDCDTKYKKDGTLQKGISPDLISSISGELQSFSSLTSKIRNLENKLNERMHSIENEQYYVRIIGGIAISIIVGAIIVVGRWAVNEAFFSSPAPQISSAAAAGSTVSSVPKARPIGPPIQNLSGTTTTATSGASPGEPTQQNDATRTKSMETRAPPRGQ